MTTDSMKDLTDEGRKQRRAEMDRLKERLIDEARKFMRPHIEEPDDFVPVTCGRELQPEEIHPDPPKLEPWPRTPLLPLKTFDRCFRKPPE
jgi:hypothetical protein